MATRVNNGDINWNGNWQTVSQEKALHASTNLSVGASAQQSASWTGDGVTVHLGVLLYLASISGTGTFKVALEKNTGSWVEIQSTTFITTSATKAVNYLFFKFAATGTETGDSLRINVSRTSGTGSMSFRADNASTTNLAITCVLNATATLSAADVTYVVGTIQGATANPTPQTVTVNVNDTTNDYGAVWIGSGGVLKWSDSASTTTNLDLAGNIYLYKNGTLNMGTVATPIPSTSSATLRFNASSNGQYGIIKKYESVLTVQGASKTYRRTTLSADIASGTIVSFTTTDSTGWAVGDQIYLCYCKGNLASSTDELVTITGISGTTIYIDSNGNGTGTGVSLGNHHGHEAPQGIVANMTRSANIKAKTTTYGWYLTWESSGSHTDADFDWARFEYIGGATQYKTGWCGEGNVSTFAFNLDNCVFYQRTSGGSWNNYTLAASYTHTGNITYECSFYSSNGLSNSSTNNWLIDCLFGVVTSSGNNAIIGLQGKGNLLRCDVITTNNTGGDTSVYSSATAGDVIDCTFSNFAFGNVKRLFNTIPRYESGNKINYYGGGDPGYNLYISASSLTRHQCINMLVDASITTAVAPTPSAYGLYAPVFKFANWQQVAGRHYAVAPYGTISDQITNGQTAAYAKGGSGICVALNPTSTTYPLHWEFWIPVTAATQFTLKFYPTKTVSGFDGTVKVSIYDSDDDQTLLLNEESIAVASIPYNDGTGDDWTYQYSATPVTPTNTGFCRVIVAVVNGATSGDILIDSVSVT